MLFPLYVTGPLQSNVEAAGVGDCCGAVCASREVLDDSSPHLTVRLMIGAAALDAHRNSPITVSEEVDRDLFEFCETPLLHLLQLRRRSGTPLSRMINRLGISRIRSAGKMEERKY